MTAKEQTLEKTSTPRISSLKTAEAFPDVDIYADNNAFFIEAALPGIDESTLDVSFEKNILTIRASAKQEVSENYQLRYAEFSPRNFRRSFQLSEDIDHDSIEAVIKNGLLRLRLPVKEPFSRKITVKTA